MQRNKFFKLFLKLLVVLLAYGYIYIKITAISADWASVKVHSYAYIGLAILLMPLNWLIESLKWRFLLQDVERISVKKAIAGVLVGITSGLATPNRVGEYFGRAIVLKKGHRIKGSLATMMGSIAQVMITVLIGLTAFLWMFYEMNFFDTGGMKFIFVGLVVGFLSLLIFLYYHLEYIKRLGRWLKVPQKYLDEITYLNGFNRFQLSYVIGLSFLRYLVFGSQYLLLLYAFGTDISILEAVCSIGIVYLLILFIPHFFIAELGVRASVAVLVFQIYTPDIEAVMLSASILWLINLALTGAMGSLQFLLFPFKSEKTSD